MKYFLLLTLISQIVMAQSSSSLEAECSQEGFACGSCEEGLQQGFNDILDGITEQSLEADHWSDLKQDIPEEGSNIQFKEPMPKYEDVLQNIIGLMRENTPGGNLNMVVIGESESLQQTSVKDGKMNPRIMLKSPNSELMVTFATDPELPGYNSIEVMRWNGKKGSYEFQEINFGDQGEPPHIDLSGKKCAECHKSPSMRPNWDTYRAWAGVIPSRDDMLEMDYKDGEFQDPMQPDGRAYISFLDQIAQAKDNPTDTRSQRLAMLDIPFDTETQLEDEYKKFKKENDREPTEAEKVAMIRSNVEEEGFYRIRHHPDYTNRGSMAVNFDDKTAEAAGPSQFAFDQMLAQNMCRVATTLKEHPDFDKFKYAVTAMAKCYMNGNFSDLSELMPESYLKKIVAYQNKTQGSTMTEIDPEIRADLSDKSANDIFNLLEEDTRKSHGRANGFKYNRHEKFLTSFLSGVEGVDPEKSSEQAKFYSEEITTPSQYSPLSWHAISDPGGVSGVAEDSTERLAGYRFMLEPFGVNVEHWSLVNGQDTAYNSYSFSDQFGLFEDQKLWSDIYKEVDAELDANGGGDVCEELVKRSVASLEEEEAVIDEEEIRIGYIDQLCNSLQIITPDESTEDLVQTANQFQLNVLQNDARKMLGKCMTCHSTGPFPPQFTGMQEYIDGEGSEEFINLLNSEKGAQKYIDIFMDKLGVHGPTSVGGAMPPVQWEDNEQFAKNYELDPLNIQNERRKILGLYLYTLSQSENGKVDLRNMCSTETQDRNSSIENDRSSGDQAQQEDSGAVEN